MICNELSRELNYRSDESTLLYECAVLLIKNDKKNFSISLRDLHFKTIEKNQTKYCFDTIKHLKVFLFLSQRKIRFVCKLTQTFQDSCYYLRFECANKIKEIKKIIISIPSPIFSTYKRENENKTLGWWFWLLTVDAKISCGQHPMRKLLHTLAS